MHMARKVIKVAKLARKGLTGTTIPGAASSWN